MHVFRDLERREREVGRAVCVGVVGAGFFGSGLVRRLEKVRGMRAGVVANRTLSRAIDAIRSAGVGDRDIVVTDDGDAAGRAVEEGKYVATSRLDLPAEVSTVDVIMEATGDVLVGAAVALGAIRAGKHAVCANPECQATVGAMLRREADRYGVIYSDVDGDEPGISKRLVDFVEGLGFDVRLAGNCKGVLKPWATPETQRGFAEANGLQPWMATAAADGTKLHFEMTCVANATGYGLPGGRSVDMSGTTVTPETLVGDLEAAGVLGDGIGLGVVDYVFGMSSGVFCIVRCEDVQTRRELKYLKMGDGPHYVLRRPHVLIHYEAPLSAAEAVLYSHATITPLPGEPVAETVAYAKRDLAAGRRLDGIGGFDVRGVITSGELARREGLVPIGLASCFRVIRPVAADAPIRWEAVEPVEDNELLALRRRQDAGGDT